MSPRTLLARIAVVAMLLCAAATAVNAATAASLYSASQVQATSEVLAVVKAAFPDQLREAWASDDFCAYAQVTCTAEGVELHLSAQNLVGTMPALSADTNAEEVMVSMLDLSNNPDIRGNVDFTWYTLPRLVHFDISGCNLGLA